MNRLKNIPEEMKALPHWVAAKGKIPYDTKTRRAAKVNDPSRGNGWAGNRWRNQQRKRLSVIHIIARSRRCGNHET